jgi:predicted 2-oxoglutarate/Fe(II)-dependent dioxygenase YbiX
MAAMSAPSPLRPTPFQTGDLLPALALPDSAGQPFDLALQTIADRYRLLLLGAAAERQAGDPAIDKAGAVPIVVLPQSPPGRPAGAGPVRVFDADRKLFLGLGLAEGGVALLTPRGRLAYAGTGEAALATALALVPPPAPAAPVRRGGAPALIIPDILEPDFIAALIAHWEKGEKSMDRVASAAAGSGAGRIANIKRRADVFLDDRALYEGFQRRIERRVAPEMWHAFRFRAASFEAPRIGCYDAANAGAFGAHRDNRTPYTAHRRFAMSLNLNTGQYEGGTLRFGEFGPEEYEPEAGGAVIFCCDLLHEALPVTKGRRFAIFTFFTDAEGAQQERKLMAEAQARGQAGVTLR